MLDNKEIWKDCKGYEGSYQVSSLGRIWSVKSQKYLIPQVDRGYYKTSLIATNGKRKKELIHRLVALAFIPNPDKLPQVNHLDEDTSNNRVDNLEWCDAKYNSNYGTRTERSAAAHRKKVYCEELEREFESITDAANELGLRQCLISQVCNGNQKTTGGYHFHFIDDTKR